MRSTPVSARRFPPVIVGGVAGTTGASPRPPARSRSAWVTKPPGPLPAIVLRSIPSSAARRRTSGDAGGIATIGREAVTSAGGSLRRERGADSLVP